MKAPLESFLDHLVKRRLCLHSRTALLESLGWDEEALEVLLVSSVFELSRLLEDATEAEKASPVILIALRERLKGTGSPNQIDIVMELLQAEAASFFECSEENDCD
jgi:hypothetical protein